MYYFFAFIAFVVVVVAAVFYFTGRGAGFAHHHNEVHEELNDPGTPTLEYAVPVGQDPTVVLAALHQAGYTATSDPTHPEQTVLVECTDGVDRERVRRVIASAAVTTPEDGAAAPARVLFRDEA